MTDQNIASISKNGTTSATTSVSGTSSTLQPKDREGVWFIDIPPHVCPSPVQQIEETSSDDNYDSQFVSILYLWPVLIVISIIVLIYIIAYA